MRVPIEQLLLAVEIISFSVTEILLTVLDGYFIFCALGRSRTYTYWFTIGHHFGIVFHHFVTHIILKVSTPGNVDKIILEKHWTQFPKNNSVDRRFVRFRRMTRRCRAPNTTEYKIPITLLDGYFIFCALDRNP